MNQLITICGLVVLCAMGSSIFLTKKSHAQIEANCSYDTGQYDSVCGNISRVSIHQAYPGLVVKWGADLVAQRFAGQTQCMVSFCTRHKMLKKGFNPAEIKDWFRAQNPCCTAVGLDAYNTGRGVGTARRVTR